MANVVKLNSNRGIVHFSFEDLVEGNLLRYIRTSFKGIGKKGLLTDHPFETVAANKYKEEYPSDQVKIAEKCILTFDTDNKPSVEVVLRVSRDNSSDMYTTNDNEVVFKKDEKKRAQ